MEIFLIALVVCAAVGARSLVTSATASSKAAMARWSAAVSKSGPVRTSRGAARTAAGVYAAGHAFVMWARAGRHGLRIGWRYGRMRAQQRLNPVEPPPRASAPSRPTPTPASTPTPTTSPTEPRSAPTTTTATQEERPVSNTTQPSPYGEIANLETAIAGAEAMRDEAMSELDDSQNEANRLAEQINAQEAFAASLRGLEFPENVCMYADSVLDATKVSLNAAQARTQAAEAKLNAARALIAKLYEHQGIQDAADATGGMAKKEAYVG